MTTSTLQRPCRSRFIEAAAGPTAASVVAIWLATAAACGDNVTAALPDAALIDAPSEPDGAPPDAAPPPTLGPSVVFDDVHIAGLFEDAHAFSLLGQAVNPQLEMLIADGMLLLGIELRDVEEPTAPTDDTMTVGMYYLADTDADPGDNFDVDAPEVFELQPGSMVEGEPAVHFVTASVANRRLHAEGVQSLDLLGDVFPVPISNLQIDGRLVSDDMHIRELVDGRLRGAVAAALLSLTPNVTNGMCAGDSLLDVLASGCGLFPLQPDSDTDGDGLETFHDTDGDGVVDQCIDGDGTEITGTDCPRNPAIADGYELIFVIHGVRAHILE